MDYFIGVDIGGTKIAYGLFDAKRKLLAKKKSYSDDELEASAYFAQVVSDVKDLAKVNQIRVEDIKGLGIGVAGVVDFRVGKLVSVASLPKLNGFYLLDYLKRELSSSIKIVIDNDCHCGALAEYRHGVGRRYQHMLYCPVSTGISSGIIIDGKLFRGSNGASGESGHTLSAVEGELLVPCACGNSGCYNSLGSGKGITVHIRRWIAEGQNTIMTKLAGSPEEITAIHIDKAYELGDAMAKKAVNQMSHYLGMWLFNTYNLLNIDCIVFSGGLLKMGDKLIDGVIKEFYSFQQNGFPVHFHKTELGNDSGLYGAVELLFD